jgi:hypothetical protein
MPWLMCGGNSISVEVFLDAPSRDGRSCGYFKLEGTWIALKNETLYAPRQQLEDLMNEQRILHATSLLFPNTHSVLGIVPDPGIGPILDIAPVSSIVPGDLHVEVHDSS